MWTVAKIKRKELNIFKNKLIEKFGEETKFYYPKIEYNTLRKNRLKKIEKPVLENYIFCYNEKFCQGSAIKDLRFLKGLEYFLSGHDINQSEIIKFIEHCKEFENPEGYLTPAFFKIMITKKAKFISGPFTNIVFEILERQKNKLKILINNIVTTVSDNKNYLYSPI